VILLTDGEEPNVIVSSGGFFKSEVSIIDNQVMGYLHPRCCESGEITAPTSLKFISEEEGIKIQIMVMNPNEDP
jgi:hypothetical protein